MVQNYRTGDSPLFGPLYVGEVRTHASKVQKKLININTIKLMHTHTHTTTVRASIIDLVGTLFLISFLLGF